MNQWRLASGQLEYLSCVWQNLSFSDHPHLRPSFSHIVAQRVLPYISTPLSLSRDSRRVRVRMFGYAKCSRASQVECLMALFCLNTDLDTTAERCLQICIRSPAASTCLLLGCAGLPSRTFHVELHQRTPSLFLRELRDVIRLFKDPKARRYVTDEIHAWRHILPTWLHRGNWVDYFQTIYKSRIS